MRKGRSGVPDGSMSSWSISSGKLTVDQAPRNKDIELPIQIPNRSWIANQLNRVIFFIFFLYLFTFFFVFIYYVPHGEGTSYKFL